MPTSTPPVGVTVREDPAHTASAGRPAAAGGPRSTRAPETTSEPASSARVLTWKDSSAPMVTVSAPALMVTSARLLFGTLPTSHAAGVFQSALMPAFQLKMVTVRAPTLS